MRTKVTLVLLFLNVALFYFIFFIRERVMPVSATAGIFGAQSVDIQAIAISYSNNLPAVRLEKRRNDWFVVEPFDWPANDFAVTKIIGEIQFLRPEASFPVADLGKTGQTLADFGLEKPPLTLEFTPAVFDGSPAAPVVVKIGDDTPNGNNLYILSPDGQQVHVVNRSLLVGLTLKAEDLRDNRLFTIPVYEARSLSLETRGGAQRVHLLNENDRWSFTSPLSVRANRRNTELTITRLRELRVKEFPRDLPGDAARNGQSNPELRIRLGGNKHSQTLLLDAEVPVASQAASVPAGKTDAPASEPSRDFFARLEIDPLPIARARVFVVSVPESLLRDLRSAQTELRERRILDFNPIAIGAITVSEPGQPELTLQRLDAAGAQDAGTWQIVRRAIDPTVQPSSVSADRDVVGRLLKTLSQLAAEDFVHDAPGDAEKEAFGFNRPVRQITLTSVPSRTPGVPTPPPVTLQIGRGATDQKVYARLASQSFVYRVSPEILQDAPVSPLVYRERLLRDLPAGAQIVALKLVELGTEKTLFEISLPATPSPASPLAANGSTPTPATPAPTDTPPPQSLPPAVVELVKHLRTLRARSFIADGFPKTIFAGGEERRWKYQLDATISLVGGSGAGTETLQLFFLERTGGATQIVGLNSQNPVVFEAEQPLLDALFALTYGPRDPGPTQPQPEPAAKPAVTPTPPAK